MADTGEIVAGATGLGAFLGAWFGALKLRKRKQAGSEEPTMDHVIADHERRLTILEERDREDREERERRDRRDEQYRQEVKALIEGIFKQMAQIRDDTTTLKAILDERRAKR